MRNYFIIILFIILITGCGKSNSPSPVVTPPVLPVALPPDKPILTSPASNAACTTGTVISTTQSSITFIWAASANTDSYNIGIKNLVTQTLTYQTTTMTTLTATLLRNTPYSWFVVSKSKAVADTSKSDVWKFYNAGPGAMAYAPFPADITLPTLNQKVTVTGGTINLTWQGSSIDNDIAGYDVYFGTTASPAVFKSNVTNMFLNNVAVTSGTTYYWKIVTKDLPGDTSDSGVFSFTVN